MKKYFIQEKTKNELINQFDKDSQAYNDLIDKIKEIENFNFDIEEIKVQDYIDDENIVINNESAFSESEISEFKLLQSKFAIVLKELQFINNIYMNQKKCASQNKDFEMAIKIKVLIGEIDNKVNCEKAAIYNLNKLINEKEKVFASKVLDFKSVLDKMRYDNNIDRNKLVSLFGEDFVDGYKIRLMSKIIVDFLKNNKDYDFDDIVTNSSYFKNIINKYPSLIEKVYNVLGTNS